MKLVKSLGKLWRRDNINISTEYTDFGAGNWNELLATASFVSCHYRSVEPPCSNNRNLSRKQLWVPVKDVHSIKMLYKLVTFKLAIRTDTCTEKETKKLSTPIKHSFDINVSWYNYPRYTKRRLTWLVTTCVERDFLNTLVKERCKGTEDEEEDVSSYWMILGKEDTGIGERKRQIAITGELLEQAIYLSQDKLLSE